MTEPSHVCGQGKTPNFIQFLGGPKEFQSNIICNFNFQVFSNLFASCLSSCTCRISKGQVQMPHRATWKDESSNRALMGFLSAWAFTSSSWTKERIRQTAKKLLETSWILQNLLGNLSLLFPCWTLLNLFEQYKHVQIRFASRLPFLDHSTYPTSPQVTPSSTDHGAVLVRKLCHWPQDEWPAWGGFHVLQRLCFS